MKPLVHLELGGAKQLRATRKQARPAFLEVLLFHPEQLSYCVGNKGLEIASRKLLQ